MRYIRLVMMSVLTVTSFALQGARPKKTFDQKFAEFEKKYSAQQKKPRSISNLATRCRTLKRDIEQFIALLPRTADVELVHTILQRRVETIQELQGLLNVAPASEKTQETLNRVNDQLGQVIQTVKAALEFSQSPQARDQAMLEMNDEEQSEEEQLVPPLRSLLPLDQEIVATKEEGSITDSSPAQDIAENAPLQDENKQSSALNLNVLNQWIEANSKHEVAEHLPDIINLLQSIPAGSRQAKVNELIETLKRMSNGQVRAIDPDKVMSTLQEILAIIDKEIKEVEKIDTPQAQQTRAWFYNAKVGVIVFMVAIMFVKFFQVMVQNTVPSTE